MNSTKVSIKNNQHAVKIPTGIRMLIRRCCNAVLQLEDFDGPAEVDITFVDDAEIRALNARTRGIDAVTDVLSFPLGQDGIYDLNHDTGNKQLGDIVINVARAAEQAERFGHSFQREMGYLTAHSMLHLLGYDHERGGIEQVRMREKEEAAMNLLGIPRDGGYADKYNDGE